MMEQGLDIQFMKIVGPIPKCMPLWPVALICLGTCECLFRRGILAPLLFSLSHLDTQRPLLYTFFAICNSRANVSKSLSARK